MPCSEGRRWALQGCLLVINGQAPLNHHPTHPPTRPPAGPPTCHTTRPCPKVAHQPRDGMRYDPRDPLPWHHKATIQHGPDGVPAFVHRRARAHPWREGFTPFRCFVHTTGRGIAPASLSPPPHPTTHPASPDTLLPPPYPGRIQIRSSSPSPRAKTPTRESSLTSPRR